VKPHRVVPTYLGSAAKALIAALEASNIPASAIRWCWRMKSRSPAGTVKVSKK
jgi:hypothetical protein